MHNLNYFFCKFSQRFIKNIFKRIEEQVLRHSNSSIERPC